jgi:hypothetical protein
MLCNRLAIDLLGKLKMRAVSGVVGFGAMATGTPTAPGSTGDRTWLKVTEFGDFLVSSKADRRGMSRFARAEGLQNSGLGGWWCAIRCDWQYGHQLCQSIGMNVHPV